MAYDDVKCDACGGTGETVAEVNHTRDCMFNPKNKAKVDPPKRRRR